MVTDLLQKEFFLGVNSKVSDVRLLNKEQVLYCCGNHVLVWCKTQKSQTFLHHCSSNEEIRLIHLCPSRKIIAIVVAQKDATVETKDSDEDLSSSVALTHSLPVASSSPGPGSSQGQYIVFYDAMTFHRQKILRPTIENIICVSCSKDGKLCLIVGDKPDVLLSLWDIEKTVPKQIGSTKLVVPSGKVVRRADLCPSLDITTKASENCGVDKTLCYICVSGDGILRIFVVDGSYNFRPKTLKMNFQVSCTEQHNYIHHCWLSTSNSNKSSDCDCIVVLATDKNEMVVISDFEANIITSLNDDDWRTGTLPNDKSSSQSISAIAPAPFSRGIWVGGDQGSIRLYDVSNEHGHVEFSRTVQDYLIKDEFNNSGSEVIRGLDQLEDESFALYRTCSGRVGNFEGQDIIPRFHRSINAYNGKITCMSLCAWKPIIATGGTDETLRIWNYLDRKSELIHNFHEEIISVSLHPTSQQILVCTKSHVEVSFVKSNGLECLWRRELQSNRSSCYSFGGAYYAIVLGPFVQIYNSYSQQLVSTLRGHAASIISVCWKRDDQDLATFSEDGVMCVWKAWSGKRLLRHADESGCQYANGFLNEDFTTAVMNVTSGGIKVLNLENLTYDNACSISNGSNILAYEAGTLIGTNSLASSTRNEGCTVWIRNLKNDDTCDKNEFRSCFCLHSQKISFAKISLFHGMLFTASNDGSLCVSRIHKRFVPDFTYKYNEDTGPIVISEILMPRENLSQMDATIANLRSNIETIKQSQSEEVERHKCLYEDSVKAVDRRLAQEKDEIAKRLEEEQLKAKQLKDKYETDLHEEKIKGKDTIEEAKKRQESEINSRLELMKEYETASEEKVLSWKRKIKEAADSQREEVEAISEKFQIEMENEKARQKHIVASMEKSALDHIRYVEALDEQAEIEIRQLQISHVATMARTQALHQRRLDEYEIIQSEYDALSKEYQAKKDVTETQQKEQSLLEENISNLKQKKNSLRKDIEDEERSLKGIETRIRSLKEEICTLESEKSDHTEMIAQIKQTLLPKEREMLNLDEENKVLDSNIFNAKKERKHLSLELNNRAMRVNSWGKELALNKISLKAKEDEVSRLESKLAMVCSLSNSMPDLKKCLMKLSSEYFEDNGKQRTRVLSTNGADSSVADCDALRAKIQTISDVMELNETSHASKVRRLKKEKVILSKQLHEINAELFSTKQQQIEIMNG